MEYIGRQYDEHARAQKSMYKLDDMEKIQPLNDKHHKVSFGTKKKSKTQNNRKKHEKTFRYETTDAMTKERIEGYKKIERSQEKTIPRTRTSKRWKGRRKRILTNACRNECQYVHALPPPTPPA